MENLTKDLVNATINYKNSQDILPDSEAAKNVTLQFEVVIEEICHHHKIFIKTDH